SEVRIRGAEANHTLLFIDGIRANDPAAGDVPRFELLNADLASRIEVVRGPQSALWGSDAIGGVVAISGNDQPGFSAASEAGSFGFRRATASGGVAREKASLSGAIGFQRASGINSFDGPGDKEGYRNLSGRLRGTFAVSPALRLGASGFILTGRSQYDGFDPFSFAHADTLDSTRNRLAAGRLWVEVGDRHKPWAGHVAISALTSTNRNLLAGDPVNRTAGKRRTIEGQVERHVITGAIDHRLILAAESEDERFHSRDVIYGGFSNQDQSRAHQAVTAEWRGETKRFTADLALRRDIFNRFKDATTLRVSGLAKLGGGFSIAASYGEGIAQPTFFDLYGFFPGSFIGNPSLKPESSRGVEGSLRYRKGAISGALTLYRQRLHDEIVDVFDFATFQSSTVNRARTSRRGGVELELGWQLSERLRVSGNYAYLRATQPDDFGGGQLTELRRPKSSGSVALDGSAGKFAYGASLAFVGKRDDRRDSFPYDVVSLKAYALLSARLAYTVRPGIEGFARISNALGSRFEDVYNYRTEGRGIFAGIRVAPRR
ncbi:MAG: TonB-dependent receptor, partial [Sphingomicrobium sp.]